MKIPKANAAPRLRPNGKTPEERLYSLFRYHCAIIAKRERTRERCKDCFRLGIKYRQSRNPVVWRGCDGCAEMETFLHDAAVAFRDLYGEGMAHLP